MGKSKKVTTGYKYHLGMHLVITHAKSDEADELSVTEFIVGERQAWAGTVSSNSSISVNAPELFGGEKREGGVQGTVDVLLGGPTQVENDYLVLLNGGTQPSYLGVLSLVLRQVYMAANNPYIKPWWIRVRRFFKGWNPTKSEIGSGGANAAHIIYECITNPEWGMGMPASIIIDDASFTAAANQLHTEGFGLHLLWDAQSSIEDFIQEVTDHIGGVVDVNPTTGKFVLKLIRGDYDPGTLTEFGQDDILSMESMQRGLYGETVNEIVLQYTDKASFKTASVTVQDLANIQIQGAIVSRTQKYPGIADPELAGRVALRDLTASATPLAKASFIINRRGWKLGPGEVFKLSWPPLGIVSVVMRVGAVDSGGLEDGQIRVEAVEDVFGLPASSYTSPQPVGWADPSPEPVAITVRKLVEAPYWDLATTLTAADLSFVDETDCFVQTLAARPTGGVVNYDIANSSQVVVATGDFSPTALALAALPVEVSSVITYWSDIDVDLVSTNSLAYINDECVHVTAINTGSKTITVNRGVLDTTPVAHAADSRIWFATDLKGEDPTEYAVSENVTLRLLMNTGHGTFPYASATGVSLVMARRQNRPYPPGKLLLNTIAYPASVVGALVITWAHRDRLSQLASIIPQTTGNIGPELGTTYTVKVIDASTSTVLETTAGITGTSHTPAALVSSYTLRVEVWSVRDTIDSWQVAKHTFSYAPS
jgi:hypothetical protein